MAAYRENYSTNHILIKLIENWKKALEEKFLVDAVLMDLSKALRNKKQLLSSIRILNVGNKKQKLTIF